MRRRDEEESRREEYTRGEKGIGEKSTREERKEVESKGEKN